MSSLMGRATLGRCMAFPFLYMSNHLWLVSFILIRRLRIFQSHRAMVGRFSSPTDETVFFNFHSCKSLYIIYSARALSTLCILCHSVCGSCCTLGECLKILIPPTHKPGQPSPDVFTDAQSARAEGDSAGHGAAILCRSS